MAGLIDFEVVFPPGRITVEQIHQTSGVSVPEILGITHCREFPALGPGEQAWELAVDAAITVLDRTGTDPDDITRVIYAGAGFWDAPAWSPAAKVADELGITQAHCFEVANFCNALTLGIRLAIEGLAPGSMEKALVIAAEQFARAVDRRDPDAKALFNFGDAGAAVLVGADSLFAYLDGTARTDPVWCDYFVGDYHETGVHMRRRGRRKGLGEAYVENLVALTEQTLGKIGRKLPDVRFLLFNQNDKNIQDRVLAALGLSVERSVYQHAQLGHMGCADTLIALRRLQDERVLVDGDLVLLAGSGAGFSWSVTALEYHALEQGGR
ncbi:3-oxoacyl-ACP synthase III family protein [Nonomuraea sp. NPDC004354]